MSFLVSFVAAWIVADGAKTLFSLGEIPASVLFGFLLGAINWALIRMLTNRATSDR